MDGEKDAPEPPSDGRQQQHSSGGPPESDTDSARPIHEDDEKAPSPPSVHDDAGAAGDAGLEAAAEPVARSRSRASTAPTVVPRSRRRGLFGRFAVLPEVERPLEYTNKIKWLITLIVALAAGRGPRSAPAYSTVCPCSDSPFFRPTLYISRLIDLRAPFSRPTLYIPFQSESPFPVPRFTSLAGLRAPFPVPRSTSLASLRAPLPFHALRVYAWRRRTG